MSVARGEREPFEGWSSPRLDQLVPAPLVKWDTTLDGRLDAVTLLSPISADARWPDVDLLVQGDGRIARIKLTSSTRSESLLLDLPW
jgi:hypothetical protein